MRPFYAIAGRFTRKAQQYVRKAPDRKVRANSRLQIEPQHLHRRPQAWPIARLGLQLSRLHRQRDIDDVQADHDGVEHEHGHEERLPHGLGKFQVLSLQRRVHHPGHERGHHTE